MKLFDINLPKWPECRVEGKRVTQDQAAAIIIRTQNFHLFTNDKEFENKLVNVLGVKSTKYGGIEWQDSEFLSNKYKCLELEYLQNHRICSAYIGGPHGWMNWDGEIYQVGVNIGKWPSVEDVYNEWKLIAEAFPFLELKCQLFNEEGSEESENKKVLIQFNIKDGGVSICEPGKIIDIRDWTFEKHIGDINRKDRERGCTIERFKTALNITLESLN